MFSIDWLLSMSNEKYEAITEAVRSSISTYTHALQSRILTAQMPSNKVDGRVTMTYSCDTMAVAMYFRYAGMDHLRIRLPYTVKNKNENVQTMEMAAAVMKQF